MELLKNSKLLPVILMVVRVLIGWHFFYEGIVKLASPDWSASSYLMDTKWLFSGFFHWIVANPNVMGIVDFMNIWGLIFIGIGLFIGVFTRIASFSGILLLLLYYVANPPFVDSVLPSEGHYYFVNKNLIEALFLLVLVVLPKGYLWGIDRLIGVLHQKRKERLFPQQDNHEYLETATNSRRELIKNLAVVPVFGGVFFGMAKKQGWISFEEENLSKVDAKSGATVTFKVGESLKELKGKVPSGRIGKVEISRIIAGGNLVSGFAHSRDLIYVSSFLKSYFTDEKVIETLWMCEACGVNTALLRTDDNTIRILNKYWKRGGKIQWLAQTYPKPGDLSNTQRAIDNGATGAFVMGSIADKYVLENKIENLANAVELIRKNGLIGGTAAHSLQVPMACINEGIEVDFFMKTFHHDNYWSAIPQESRSEFSEIGKKSNDHNQYHDNIWCANWQSTAAFFKDIPIPWIAYKVLAAGAIHPKEGFRHVFENGADFACVGMFDFQVVENANITHGLLSGDLKRERKWYG